MFSPNTDTRKNSVEGGNFVETSFGPPLEIPTGYRDMLIVIPSIGSGLGNISFAESLLRLLQRRFRGVSLRFAGNRRELGIRGALSFLEQASGQTVVDYQGGSFGVFQEIAPDSVPRYVAPKADMALYVGWPKPYGQNAPYRLADASLHVHIPMHFAKKSELERVEISPVFGANISTASPFAVNAALVPDLSIWEKRRAALAAGARGLIRARISFLSALKKFGCSLDPSTLQLSWTVAYTHKPSALKDFVLRLAQYPAFKKATLLFLFRGSRATWPNNTLAELSCSGVRIVDMKVGIESKYLLQALWGCLGAIEPTTNHLGAVPALVTGDTSFIEALSAGVPAIHDGVDGPSMGSGYRRMYQLFGGPLAALGAKYNPGYCDVNWSRLFISDPVAMHSEWLRETTRWLELSDISRSIFKVICAHSRGEPFASEPLLVLSAGTAPARLEKGQCPPSCTDLGFFWALYNCECPIYYPELIFQSGVHGSKVVDAFRSWGLIVGASDPYNIHLTKAARARADSIVQVFLKCGLWSDLSARDSYDPVRAALCEDLARALKA